MFILNILDPKMRSVTCCRFFLQISELSFWAICYVFLDLQILCGWCCVSPLGELDIFPSRLVQFFLLCGSLENINWGKILVFDEYIHCTSFRIGCPPYFFSSILPNFQSQICVRMWSFLIVSLLISRFIFANFTCDYWDLMKQK